MSGTFVIDCFPETAERYRPDHAIVAIDVIRATTTATTALSRGRRVFPARTTDEAALIAGLLQDPLLVGELGGNTPDGFDVTNSPAQIALRVDNHRPMVLVSSSGTQLILTAAGAEAVYIACLRNYSAVARHIAGRHTRVAIIGAGTRGQFRREDQIGCVLVAMRLRELGYTPQNDETKERLARWGGAPLDELRDAIRSGNSAQYLRRSEQHHDLEFMLSHIDDLAIVPAMVDAVLVDVTASAGALQVAAGNYLGIE